MRTVRSALSALTLALPAAAGTLLVPSEHESIQAAVNAAVSGDIILIGGGHYPESVLLAGKQLVRLVAKGKVVIDPPEGQVGVTLDGSTNCRLEKLRIDATDAPFGIHIVDGHDNLVLKCRVEGAALAGIRLDGGHTQFLESCTVKGGAGDGIALGTGSANAVDNCLISKCKLTGSGLDGLSLNGSNNRIEKCQVLKPAGDGLREDEASPGLVNVFEQCKIVQAGGRGVVLRHDDPTARKLRVVKSAGHGIVLLAGISALLEDCRVVKPLGDGIVVDTGGATLDGCRISGSAGNGIAIAGGSPIVIGCRVSGAGLNGCSMSGDAGSFEENKVSGSEASGFLLEDGAELNLLTGNKASGSGEFDLFDDSGDPESNDYEDNLFKTIGITVPAR